MFPYRIHIRYSCEDEAFIAEAPALPGCMADGETPEAAAAALEVVAAEWIDVARDLGRPIPEPDAG